MTVIGCGDAFGSGGRYHSCYILETSKGRLLLDCGANSPLALKRAGLPLQTSTPWSSAIAMATISAACPSCSWTRCSWRAAPSPLRSWGLPASRARTEALLECLYPAIKDLPRKFELVYSELPPGKATPWRGLPIRAFEVNHASGSPSLALSFEDEGRLFAFSGDCSWCDGVTLAGRGADLYLIECTYFSTKSSMHLDYLTLAVEVRRNRREALSAYPYGRGNAGRARTKSTPHAASPPRKGCP